MGFLGIQHYVGMCNCTMRRVDIRIIFSKFGSSNGSLLLSFRVKLWLAVHFSVNVAVRWLADTGLYWEDSFALEHAPVFNWCTIVSWIMYQKCNITSTNGKHCKKIFIKIGRTVAMMTSLWELCVNKCHEIQYPNYLATLFICR